MRAGQSAQRRSVDACARARSGATGAPLGRLRPDAGGADDPDRQPLLRLEVRVRARAEPRRPAGVPRPRQAARWLVEHQRDDLPARQPTGLRAVGRRSRHGALGPCPLPAVLQADGGLPRRPGGRPVSGSRRPPRARARSGDQPTVRRLLRRRPAGRARPDRRRQRLSPGGLRGVRPQRAARPTPECIPRIPATGAAPAQPRGGHAGDGHPAADRRQPGHRCRLHASRPASRACGGGRGHPLWRRVQLSAGAPGVGRR